VRRQKPAAGRQLPSAKRKRLKASLRFVANIQFVPPHSVLSHIPRPFVCLPAAGRNVYRRFLFMRELPDRVAAHPQCPVHNPESVAVTVPGSQIDCPAYVLIIRPPFLPPLHTPHLHTFSLSARTRVLRPPNGLCCADHAHVLAHFVLPSLLAAAGSVRPVGVRPLSHDISSSLFL